MPCPYDIIVYGGERGGGGGGGAPKGGGGGGRGWGGGGLVPSLPCHKSGPGMLLCIIYSTITVWNANSNYYRPTISCTSAVTIKFTVFWD